MDVLNNAVVSMLYHSIVRFRLICKEPMWFLISVVLAASLSLLIMKYASKVCMEYRLDAVFARVVLLIMALLYSFPCGKGVGMLLSYIGLMVVLFTTAWMDEENGTFLLTVLLGGLLYQIVLVIADKSARYYVADNLIILIGMGLLLLLICLCGGYTVGDMGLWMMSGLSFSVVLKEYTPMALIVALLVAMISFVVRGTYKAIKARRLIGRAPFTLHIFCGIIVALGLYA